MKIVKFLFPFKSAGKITNFFDNLRYDVSILFIILIFFENYMHKEFSDDRG
jgi:hypothetical protein